VDIGRIIARSVVIRGADVRSLRLMQVPLSYVMRSPRIAQRAEFNRAL
jgi:hypothetical protein